MAAKEVFGANAAIGVSVVLETEAMDRSEEAGAAKELIGVNATIGIPEVPETEAIDGRKQTGAATELIGVNATIGISEVVEEEAIVGSNETMAAMVLNGVKAAAGSSVVLATDAIDGSDETGDAAELIGVSTVNGISVMPEREAIDGRDETRAGTELLGARARARDQLSSATSTISRRCAGVAWIRNERRLAMERGALLGSQDPARSKVLCRRARRLQARVWDKPEDLVPHLDTFEGAQPWCERLLRLMADVEGSLMGF